MLGGGTHSPNFPPHFFLGYHTPFSRSGIVSGQLETSLHQSSLYPCAQARNLSLIPDPSFPRTLHVSKACQFRPQKASQTTVDTFYIFIFLILTRGYVHWL